MAKEKLKPLEEEKERTDEEIIDLSESFEAVATDAQASLKSCNDFMAGKYLKLQGVQEQTKADAAVLFKRIREAKRDIDQGATKVKARKELAVQRRDKEAKRIAAIREEERQRSIFKAYDKDGDGRLSKG